MAAAGLDAGTAAVIGAVTGAIASLLVTVIDRVTGSFQRSNERRRSARLEQRTALLELTRALVALGATKRDTDLGSPALRVDEAIATMDLLLSGKDLPLLAAATTTASLTLSGDPKGPSAAAYFRTVAGGWYRGRWSGSEALAQFEARLKS